MTSLRRFFLVGAVCVVAMTLMVGVAWGQDLDDGGGEGVLDLDRYERAPVPPPVEEVRSEPEDAETEPAGEVHEPAVVRRQTPSGPGREVRVTAEIVTGLAGGIVGGIIGLAAGYIVSMNAFDPFGFLVASTAAGWFAGVAAGVILAGHLVDGNGKLYAAVLGEVVGIAVSLGMFAIFGADAPAIPAVGLIALPVIGATVGYELTSDESRAAAEAESGVRSIRPVIIPSEKGATVGIGLRF